VLLKSKDGVKQCDQALNTDNVKKSGLYNSSTIYFSLQATDKDFGGNGATRYSLEDGNIGNVFKIDELRYSANLLSAFCCFCCCCCCCCLLFFFLSYLLFYYLTYLLTSLPSCPSAYFLFTVETKLSGLLLRGKL